LYEITEDDKMKTIGALTLYSKHHFLNSLIGICWRAMNNNRNEIAQLISISQFKDDVLFKSHWENSYFPNTVTVLLVEAWVYNQEEICKESEVLFDNDQYVKPRVLLMGSEDHLHVLATISSSSLEKISTMYQSLLVPVSQSQK
jgi:hypothetical protein